MEDTRAIRVPHLLAGIEHLQKCWDQYQALFHQRTIPARMTILKAGEIPSKLFFIEKGCLRMSINSHGRDVTTQFFFEDDSVASIESFRLRRPSPVSIQSVEPTTLLVVHKNDARRIMEDFPEMKDVMLELMFRRFEAYSRLFVSYITQNPRERYLSLLRQDPRIVQRIPQHYIASYLGITPVSLSRIRRRI